MTVKPPHLRSEEHISGRPFGQGWRSESWLGGLGLLGAVPVRDCPCPGLRAGRVLEPSWSGAARHGTAVGVQPAGVVPAGGPARVLAAVVCWFP